VRRGRIVRFVVGACALLLLGASTAASAAPSTATMDVTIQNFTFTPASLTIDKGDTIRWTNLDSAPHSAVTGQAGFATTILAQGQSTTTIFDRPGTYDYVCGVHGASMKGTLFVRGVPVVETPPPTARGHVVVDAFAEARPDRFVDATAGGALFLYASAALALLALARFVWVLRHW
jgi:plastocyanin